MLLDTITEIKEISEKLKRGEASESDVKLLRYLIDEAYFQSQDIERLLRRTIKTISEDIEGGDVQ